MKMDIHYEDKIFYNLDLDEMELREFLINDFSEELKQGCIIDLMDGSDPVDIYGYEFSKIDILERVDPVIFEEVLYDWICYTVNEEFHEVERGGAGHIGDIIIIPQEFD